MRDGGAEPGVRADDGVLLHVESEDPGDAPVTVVFAHGFAARAEEFDGQRRALRGRARMVVYDQRGHGKSGWGGRESATIDRLGRDLGHVIDQTTGTEPVVLVAHSMGGMAAIALADQRPKLFGSKIVGVALLSTSAGRLAQTELPARAAEVALRSGLVRILVWLLWFIAPLVNALAPFKRPWARRWFRRKLFGRGDPSEEALTRLQQMWIDTPQSMATAFYPTIIYYNKPDALAVFRSIPALVLAGTDDATIPAKHSKRIAQEIGPGAHLVLIPGAGHMVNMTHSTPVNAALLELLERAGFGKC